MKMILFFVCFLADVGGKHKQHCCLIATGASHYRPASCQPSACTQCYTGKLGRAHQLCQSVQQACNNQACNNQERKTTQPKHCWRACNVSSLKRLAASCPILMPVVLTAVCAFVGERKKRRQFDTWLILCWPTLYCLEVRCPTAVSWPTNCLKSRMTPPAVPAQLPVHRQHALDMCGFNSRHQQSHSWTTAWPITKANTQNQK